MASLCIRIVLIDEITSDLNIATQIFQRSLGLDFAYWRILINLFTVSKNIQQALHAVIDRERINVNITSIGKTGDRKITILNRTSFSNNQTAGKILTDAAIRGLTNLEKASNQGGWLWTNCIILKSRDRATFHGNSEALVSTRVISTRDSQHHLTFGN